MPKYSRLVLTLFLFLSMALIPVLVSAQEGGTIEYGQVVTGEITNEVPEVRYTFEGSAGDTLTIAMNATGQEFNRVDSFLELLGPDGQSLVTDDDSGGNLNALIGPYTLPQDGTYTVVATRYMRQDGGSTGPFELVIREAELLDLAVGETITVNVGPEQPRVFLAYASQGNETLSLVAETVEGNAPFNVMVRDERGGYVNQGYAAPGGVATVDPLYLGTPGTYVFAVVREMSYNPQGQPVESEESIQIALTLQAIQPQPIELNTPVSGTLNDGNPADHYTFTGQQGDILRLVASVETGDEQIDVQFFSPDGFTFQGGTSAYSAEPDQLVIDPVQLTMGGEFLLVVRRFSPQGPVATGTSSYTLTLSETETPVLESGVEVTGSVGIEVYERVYRLEGEAGQNIRIALRSMGDTYGPAINVQGPSPDEFSQAAYIMNTNSAFPGTLQFDMTLPTTGTYLFRVNNGFYGEGPTAGEFGLTIEVE